MVRSKFDKELDMLNQELIEMGTLVEKSIDSTVAALMEKDIELAKKVAMSDNEIDEMEKIIESRCLRLILQQQPVARDLRLISSTLKMITDMERIGDQSADISEITQKIAKEEYIKELTHIPQMAQATTKMVKDSIDAFVKGDLELALAVIEYDDVVDELFNVIKNELISLIRESVDNGEQAIDLLMIAKYFERIGDHAENIAEWVYFSITGEHKRKLEL